MRSGRTNRRTNSVLRIAGALALLTLLFLAGCGAGTSGGASGPHATATPVKPLSWQVISLPGGAQLSSGNSFAVSPVNGEVAWASMQGSGGSFTIWRSQDAAAHWRQVSVLTPTAPLPVAYCTLVADQNNADGLAVVFGWGSGEAGTLASSSYYSSDGGDHWTLLPGLIAVSEVATVGQTTYAILDDTATSPAAGPIGLVSSSDGLHVWRRINPPGLAQGDGVFQFFLAPSSGEMLAATYGGLLFHSQNAGAQWTAIPTSPQAGQTAQVTLAQWLPRQGHWLFCPLPAPQSDTMQCSADLGKTWSVLPTFTTTIGCATCGKNGAPYYLTSLCRPDAISSNGTMLAICAVGSTGSAAIPNTNMLYRLLPGAAKWDTLGLAPAGFYAYANTGQLWSLGGDSGTLALLPQLP